ncbi:bcbd5bc6-467e-4863-b4dc-57801e7f2b72-CDS [Sclerotinia trifoliorum]|uniref:Bcbd5bc6-467e-4863-b4dc-57801e7f2b72-CDS n=1 Tax=Sclerotinia trifoliorum TaxID=28548 RepID=A0A8H2ZTI7_9HELO|nr:bcbd5bc6-467e-4863-b4dc-57801e7f2b72-CDS [Sclerotinia trifoliorum]
MSVIPTRVMVISDTHEHSLNGANMLDVDVLHTGDLTNFGELNALRDSIKMMGTITAELKLYHHSALEIMTGQSAKDAGVTYLKEGTHTFTLKNGAEFTVYATPYTCGSMGFQYQINEDRFNDATQIAPGQTSIATNPIPAGVDIVAAIFSVLSAVCGHLCTASDTFTKEAVKIL